MDGVENSSPFHRPVEIRQRMLKTLLKRGGPRRLALLYRVLNDRDCLES